MEKRRLPKMDMGCLQKRCDLCGKGFEKGDTVHQHVLEDEEGSAAAGMDLCENCDQKHTYKYGKSEYVFK